MFIHCHKKRKVFYDYGSYQELQNQIENKDYTEAAVQRGFWEKMFWKYAANLQKNTHAEVWFQ